MVRKERLDIVKHECAVALGITRLQLHAGLVGADLQGALEGGPHGGETLRRGKPAAEVLREIERGLRPQWFGIGEGPVHIPEDRGRAGSERRQLEIELR